MPSTVTTLDSFNCIEFCVPLSTSALPAGSSGGCVHHVVGSPGAMRRRRKLRTVFTAKQLAGLERTFAAKKYLSVPDRIQLAMELELTDTQVKTWFQNRRMKERKAAEGAVTGSR